MRNNDSKASGNPSRFMYQAANTHKGLRNETGQNNCFLNVTIQAMWHLGPFRMHLRQLITSLARGKILSSPLVDRSLVLALCNLFIQYEFTEEQVLPPDDLRQLLGQLNEKFELGKIADANEALDAILNRIHAEFSCLCPDRCKCLAHQTFGGVVMEQAMCGLCGATTEPVVSDNFLHYFQALEVLQEAAKENTVEITTGWNGRKRFQPVQRLLSFAKKQLRIRSTGEALPAAEEEKARLFGRMLRKCMMSVGLRSCPSRSDLSMSHCVPCTGQASMSSFCLEPPLALALSFGWTDEHEEKENITSFMSIISSTIFLDDLYCSGEAQEKNQRLPPFWRDTNAQPTTNVVHTGPSYALQGLVCYYGLHYVSFFQAHSIVQAEEMYFLFDDHRVRPIGSWGDVIKYCETSHYQPVLLLYELESNQRSNVELPARVIPDYNKLLSETALFDVKDSKEIKAAGSQSKGRQVGDSNKVDNKNERKVDPLIDIGSEMEMVEADQIYLSEGKKNYGRDQSHSQAKTNNTDVNDFLEGNWIAEIESVDMHISPEKNITQSSALVTSIEDIHNRNNLSHRLLDLSATQSQPVRRKSNLSEYRAIADEIQHELHASMSQRALRHAARTKQKVATTIEFWTTKPYRYSLTVPIERVNGKAFLGFEVHRDYSDESFAVISFAPHPTTSEPMFTERSNMVQLMDRLVKINGLEVRSYELSELNDIINKNDEPYVLMEFVSSYRSIKTFFCPVCGMQCELDPVKEIEIQQFLKSDERETELFLLCNHCNSSVAVAKHFPPPA